MNHGFSPFLEIFYFYFFSIFDCRFVVSCCSLECFLICGFLVAKILVSRYETYGLNLAIRIFQIYELFFLKLILVLLFLYWLLNFILNSIFLKSYRNFRVLVHWKEFLHGIRGHIIMQNNFCQMPLHFQSSIFIQEIST